MPDYPPFVAAFTAQTMRSVGFLSRIPVPSRFFETSAEHGESLREDAGAFPVAGLLIGLGPAVLLCLLNVCGVPAFLVASFCVLLQIAICGALHEDGLADVADGFGGGRTGAQRLEIMRDSRIGSYGAIALSGSMLLRVGALSAIVSAAGALPAAAAVISVAAGSRAAVVWFWASLPSVRSGGVSDRAGQPSESAVSAAIFTGIAIFAILGVAAIGFGNTAIAFLLALASQQAFSRLCVRLIGGQTGDTLGACQQIVEVMLLTGLALGFSFPN